MMHLAGYFAIMDINRTGMILIILSATLIIWLI